ncbi:MAG: lectin-like domain-containing protein, partial [Flavobacteriales bacterium]
MGFGGIGNSLGVEMDTYYGANPPSEGDLTQDHLGIQKNGSVSHVGANVIASPVPALPTNGNIENGNFHDLRVTYDANTSEMTVYFDCNERITTTVDVQETIGSTIAKWGFTAATGGATNIHRV